MVGAVRPGTTRSRASWASVELPAGDRGVPAEVGGGRRGARSAGRVAISAGG